MYMGMPGIPCVLEYMRNRLKTWYARNTFSIILAHWYIKKAQQYDRNI